MFEYFEPKSFLIVAAVGCYVLGFLARDQIVIRSLVAIGCISYIAYYSIAGPAPLWDAILGSALICAASLQGVVRLWWSRQPMSVSRRFRHIYDRMGQLEPGLFNRLMRIGTVLEVETDTILTQEARAPRALWFLVDGALSLERAGQPPVRLTRSGFIGEIAWLNGGEASATVIALPGTEIVQWSVDDLRAATRKSERLELALEALIARDLAQKLARSAPLPAKPTLVSTEKPAQTRHS